MSLVILFALHLRQEEFNADYIIWLDTIKAGRYDDTNQLFIPQLIIILELRLKMQSTGVLKFLMILK